jgi:hypothetical protein
MKPENTLDPVVVDVLEEGEQLRLRAAAKDAVLAVTDRRLVVAAPPSRIALAVPFEQVRRIQFDIERRRPATLVIVPEEFGDEPQVLAIPPEQYRAAADALVEIGRALAEPSA